VTFFGELKRRNVFRVGIAYLLAAWVSLQVVDFVLDAISAPNWIVQVFILAAAVGLPAVLVFSWVFEMTPEGVKRESEIDRSQSISPNTGRKLDRVIIVFLAVAVVLLLADRFTGNQGSEPVPTVAPTESSQSITVKADPAPVGGRLMDENATPSKTSIAVLPFVNMSSDPEQEYFSDGITEEILNRLASIRELQVAARTSAFSFKGQNQDVREIAQILGVGSILEGSVRKAGNQVRITAQLIRASDGFHLWSEAYDRKLENIFAIQDDIAGQIAEALQISLGVSGRPADTSSKLVNPEVYDLYLRARSLHRQRGEGLLQAIELFEQALAIDPDFAPAWAGLSHSYIVVINYISDEDKLRLGDVGAKSMAAAEKALELDPSLPTALHAMGNNLFFQYDWGGAEEYYQRALQMDPDSTDVMEDYASLLMFSWQLDAAQRMVERMIALDPYVPIFLYAKAGLAQTMGDFEQRDRAIAAALEINPDLGNLQLGNLNRLLQYGEFDEARRYVRQMNAAIFDLDAMLEMVDWIEQPEQDPSPGVIAAMAEGSLPALMVDRLDIWLDVIETAGAIWSEWEISAAGELLAPVTSPEVKAQQLADPRVKAWLTRLRLPEYWREVGWPDVCEPISEDDFECH